MAERSIGKRQKESAVLELLNKLILKKTGNIYILDLDKSNNLPVHIENKNEALSLAIAYYQLLTNCFTSSKKALEEFKALYICNISKCNFGNDQRADRRFRADKNMILHGSSKLKELVVNEYFDDCFKRMAALKKLTLQVLSTAKQSGDIGLNKLVDDDVLLKDVADIHTDPDVPGGNIDDLDEDFESSYGGDGLDYLDDEDEDDLLLNENTEIPDKPVNELSAEELAAFKKKLKTNNDKSILNIKKLKSKRVNEAEITTSVNIKLRDFLKWICGGLIDYLLMIKNKMFYVDDQPVEDLNIIKNYFLYNIGDIVKFNFCKLDDGYEICFKIKNKLFTAHSTLMYVKKLNEGSDKFTYLLNKYKDILSI